MSAPELVTPEPETQPAVTTTMPLGQMASWRGQVDGAAPLVDNRGYRFTPERVTIEYRRHGAEPWTWVATVSGTAHDGIGGGRIARYLTVTDHESDPAAPLWVAETATREHPARVPAVERIATALEDEASARRLVHGTSEHADQLDTWAGQLRVATVGGRAAP